MNFVSENKKVDQIYLGSFKIWCWRRIEKNQLNRSWEKWRNITKSQRGDSFPTYNEKNEGWIDWSHLAWEMHSKTCQWKKYGRKDRSDGKTRK